MQFIFFNFLRRATGRLKLKFLCERFSHCIYSFCSIELSKTRNTWSLTAEFQFQLLNNIIKFQENRGVKIIMLLNNIIKKGRKERGQIDGNNADF